MRNIIFSDSRRKFSWTQLYGVQREGSLVCVSYYKVA